ncbi:ALDO2 oxidase, partial [Pseudoatta argentina]
MYVRILSVDLKIVKSLSVSDDSVPVDTTLLVFIREYSKFRDTKAMCHAGDYGACIVSAIFKDKTIAVNSCLVLVLTCDRWNIVTSEGLGNKRNGYHAIQTALAPDLDAFKGFAIDAHPSMVKDIQDIEELYKIKSCRKDKMPCVRSLEDGHFYKVFFRIEDIFKIFGENPNATYILNGGNTAHETVGAQVHVLESFYKKKSLYLWEFLNLDMQHKIIYSVVLPSLDDIKYVCRFYKIMPRAQNARGHVDAGFLFTFGDDGKVLELSNIIFCGINMHFMHAKQTEELVNGKSIFDEKILKLIIEKLHVELQPDHVLPDYSPEFRKILAEGLFYKFLLSIQPERVDPYYRSGGTLLERGLYSGTHNKVQNVFIDISIINIYLNLCSLCK